MLIEIKEDIFSDNDFKGLNYLIQLASYKHRYDLFVELSTIRNTNTFQRLDIEDKEELEQYYNQAVTESLIPKYIISNTGGNSFNIEESIRFFTQPVSIILENSLNDAYFINTLIRFFDNSEQIVKKHLDNNWIQFENAGGCTNIQNFINGKLQSFNSLPKDKQFYLRCFVLMDSDKLFDCRKPSRQKREIRKFLNNKNILNHILHKRSMENYLPDEVFNNLPSQSWIVAYNTLIPSQKDFLDIKNGFSKKDTNGVPTIARNDLDNNIQQLYDTLSDENYEILNRGINFPDFKTEFPKLFTSIHITKQSLVRRTKHQQNSNELQEIIDKISTLI